MIQFIVNGLPRPQQRHRSRGRWTYDPSAEEKKEFAFQIKKDAPVKPMTDELDVHISFVYKRPKKHYRVKAGKLLRKQEVPFYKKSRPDLDNLIKFYLDAMQGIVYKDDSQIVSLNAQKVYGSENMVHIKIFYNKKYC